jgi:uncharacterized protein
MTHLMMLSYFKCPGNPGLFIILLLNAKCAATLNKKIDPIKLLNKYYDPGSRAYYLLVGHSRIVSEKALETAGRVKHLCPDVNFIYEAAMLHDIGIFLTDEPVIDCHGEKAYICHGYLGREILEKEGLPRHAYVCERHVGAGIAIGEIKEKKLPLPERDMLPITIEEQIICFADKFFSKSPDFLLREKPIGLIRKQISKYGTDKVKRFDEWAKMFGAV